MRIAELRRHDIEEDLGPCGDVIQSKMFFLQRQRSYMRFPWLSSSDLQQNIDNMKDELSVFLEDDGAKLATRIEYVNTNVGVFKPSVAEEKKLPDPVSGHTIYSRFLDTLGRRLARNHQAFLDKSSNLYLKVQRTSSPGMTSFERSRCAYDVDAKYQLLDYVKQHGTLATAVRVVNTWRAQIDTPGKERPALVFDGHFTNLLKWTTQSARDLGFRIRAAFGVDLQSNIAAMVDSARFNASLDEQLSHIWKSTHKDIDEMRDKGLYVFCADVSNNDYNTLYSINRRCHQLLCHPNSMDNFTALYEHGVVYGGYVDDEDRKRYYRMHLEPGDVYKPLMSGEGLTSPTNKLNHLSAQLAARWIVVHGSEPPRDFDEADAFIDKWHAFIYNNGDDLADFFETKKERDHYKEVLASFEWAEYGEEKPGYSGMAWVVDNQDRFLGVQSKYTSLIYKTLESERRDTKSPLASLPYNSIKGKIDHYHSFQLRDPGVVAEGVSLFLEMVGLGGWDYEQLEAAAADELEKATSENTRAAAIAEMLDLLDETEPHVLAWKYEIADLNKVAPNLVEELFIARPLMDYYPTSWKPEVQTKFTI